MQYRNRPTTRHTPDTPDRFRRSDRPVNHRSGLPARPRSPVTLRLAVARRPRRIPPTEPVTRCWRVHARTARRQTTPGGGPPRAHRRGPGTVVWPSRRVRLRRPRTTAAGGQRKVHHDQHNLPCRLPWRPLPRRPRPVTRSDRPPEAKPPVSGHPVESASNHLPPPIRVLRCFARRRSLRVPYVVFTCGHADATAQSTGRQGGRHGNTHGIDVRRPRDGTAGTTTAVTLRHETPPTRLPS